MRTRDQINQDFSDVCARLGNLTANFEAEKARFIEAINKLSSEMSEVVASEEVKKEE